MELEEGEAQPNSTFIYIAAVVILAVLCQGRFVCTVV
jgi:hypothetical protein